MVVIAQQGYYCALCGQVGSTAGTCTRDGSVLIARTSHNLLGHQLGNFTILAHIASGGMGDVYRAKQASIGADAAVKVLAAHVASDPVSLQRLMAEAQAANKIKSRGVPKIFDAGTIFDRCYLVMELLEGETLAQAMESTKQADVLAACQLAVEILEILDAAHQVGIIHRDVKPDNVFITTTGEIKLLDFGIARILDESNRITRQGQLLGTPAYMAPEQIRSMGLSPNMATNAPAESIVDARADLYATAVVLYQLIAGELPFDNSSMFRVLDGHLSEPPRSLDLFRTGVPNEIVSVIECALAKDPRQRFESAAAMQDALRTAMANSASQLGHSIHRARPNATSGASASENWRNPAHSGRGNRASLSIDQAGPAPSVRSSAPFPAPATPTTPRARRASIPVVMQRAIPGSNRLRTGPMMVQIADDEPAPTNEIIAQASTPSTARPRSRITIIVGAGIAIGAAAAIATWQLTRSPKSGQTSTGPASADEQGQTKGLGADKPTQGSAMQPERKTASDTAKFHCLASPQLPQVCETLIAEKPLYAACTKLGFVSGELEQVVTAAMHRICTDTSVSTQQAAMLLEQSCTSTLDSLRKSAREAGCPQSQR